MSKVEIRSNGAGRGQILIDGVDHCSAITGLVFESRPRHIDTVKLDLHLLKGGAVDSDDATVLLPVATVKLLMSLGWTPPEGTIEAMQDDTIQYVGQEKRR